MASQYFAGEFKQKLPEYCIVDTTPPVFAGITQATSFDDGSIEVEFAPATSPKMPVDYHVYIMVGSVTAAELFQIENLALHLPAGSVKGRIFLLSDQSTYLVRGQEYTVGVRANDAFGYQDTNMVIEVLTSIASGNLPAIFQSVATQLLSAVSGIAPNQINGEVLNNDEILGVVEN